MKHKIAKNAQITREKIIELLHDFKWDTRSVAKHLDLNHPILRAALQQNDGLGVILCKKQKLSAMKTA